MIDEVDEARRVVDRVAGKLAESGIEVLVFHDDTSRNQNENLNTIVDAHNSEERDPRKGEAPQPRLLLHMVQGKIVELSELSKIPEWAKPILAVAMRRVR